MLQPPRSVAVPAVDSGSPPDESRQSRGAGATRDWDLALEHCYAELCEYALRLVGSAEAAEDVVHDLFLHLWDTRGPHDAERLSRPYLYAAVRNRALKHLRHRRVAASWVERVAREEVPTAESPSDLYLRRELEDTVERAIAELPPRCREIFLLRRRDQLSYEEIAARASVSVGTVKSQMWRAAVLLNEKLAPYLVCALAGIVVGLK